MPALQLTLSQFSNNSSHQVEMIDVHHLEHGQPVDEIVTFLQWCDLMVNRSQRLNEVSEHNAGRQLFPDEARHFESTDSLGGVLTCGRNKNRKGRV